MTSSLSLEVLTKARSYQLHLIGILSSHKTKLKTFKEFSRGLWLNKKE